MTTETGMDRDAVVDEVRAGGGADVGAPPASLGSLKAPAYSADALPPELAAIRVEDPGSRRLAG